MKKTWIVRTVLTAALFVASMTAVATAEEMVDVSAFKKEGPYVVGLSNVSPANAFKIAMVEEFRGFCEANKDKVKQFHITDAGGQVAKQIADIEDLIAKKIDILLVTASSPTAISPVVEKATKAGIMTVSFDNVVATPNVTIKVEADESGIGSKNMAWLADKLGGKGKVVMLGGIKGTSSAQQRWDGAQSILKEHPAMEVVGEAWVNWAFDKGKAAMESFLAANPEIDGVWTDGGGSAQGALTALVEANRVVPLVGTASNGFAKLWTQLKNERGFEAFAATNPPYCSVTALKFALDAMEGKAVPRYIRTDLSIMDNSNVEKMVKPEFSDMFWVDTLLSDEQNQKLWGKK